MMHHHGGGGGGMFGGMRGTNAGSMFAPNSDNLTDESIIGKAYDNRVVMRLLKYILPYKKDTLISLLAVGDNLGDGFGSFETFSESFSGRGLGQAAFGGFF